jgi:hypothetical protein
MRRLLFVVVAALASGSTARAADPRPEEAKVKCLAGDVSGGVALLAELYVATRDTTYLYNQARCYQQNGRTEDAINRFREYLRIQANVAPDERQRVEGYIAELERDRDARARATATPVTATPVPAVAAAVEIDKGPPVRPLRIAAYAAGAAGALLVASGVYFSVRVHSLEAQADRNTEKNVNDPRVLSDGRNAERWQWVGYGVGGALLAGGVLAYLYSRGDDESEGPQALQIAPVITPAGAGATLRLTF